MMLHGWIGVDLDGTLATFDASGADMVGPPIPAMVQRVKRWLQEGREVHIVTARAARPSFDKLFHRAEKTQIEQWCVTHLGQILPIQAHKDYSMIELWDDRVVQVETNTGRQIGLSRVSIEAPDPLVAADVNSPAAWIRSSASCPNTLGIKSPIPSTNSPDAPSSSFADTDSTTSSFPPIS